jgi:hypothetical protein
VALFDGDCCASHALNVAAVPSTRAADRADAGASYASLFKIGPDIRPTRSPWKVLKIAILVPDYRSQAACGDDFKRPEGEVRFPVLIARNRLFRYELEGRKWRDFFDDRAISWL